MICPSRTKKLLKYLLTCYTFDSYDFNGKRFLTKMTSSLCCERYTKIWAPAGFKPRIFQIPAHILLLSQSYGARLLYKVHTHPAYCKDQQYRKHHERNWAQWIWYQRRNVHYVTRVGLSLFSTPRVKEIGKCHSNTSNSRCKVLTNTRVLPVSQTPAPYQKSDKYCACAQLSFLHHH